MQKQLARTLAVAALLAAVVSSPALAQDSNPAAVNNNPSTACGLQIPPPASELNPAVSHVISRVVHKAMAKQPWNRYDTAREFGETLQKALRNEPIPMFDSARTQPRIRTAAKALESGDHQFAHEIVTELESEGNLDPQITVLRVQIENGLGAALDDALLGPRIADRVELAVVPVLDVE